MFAWFMMRKNLLLGVFLGVVFAALHEFICDRNNANLFNESIIDFSKWDEISLTFERDSVVLTSFFAKYSFLVDEKNGSIKFEQVVKSGGVNFFCLKKNEYIIKIDEKKMSCQKVE